jgi:hypothetical protein
MTLQESTALAQAQRTVAAMHATLTLRQGAPPHVHRGYCLDCNAVVELAADHVCHCGSRSVMPHRGRRVA